MDDDGNVTEDDVLDAFYLCGPTSTGGWQPRTLDVAQYAGKRVELTL